MKIHDQRDHINRLHDLIKRKATGSLDTLAEKFHVGRSTMSRYIDEFKQEFEPPLAYDREGHSYYYTEPFDLKIWVEIRRNGERK
jgi:predicted DNA-binding transcriptional regulator YafY